MEKQTEKIRRFSKVVVILLNIAICLFIVVAVLTLAAWLSSKVVSNQEIVTLNGVNTEVPYLLKLGNTKIFLPITWKSGINFMGIGALIPGVGFLIGIQDFLGVISIIITLRFAKNIFILLRENSSPFRDDVIKALKRLTIVLLITGGIMGIVPFLAAGIAWVLCLIFDYGRVLQSESDTTL